MAGMCSILRVFFGRVILRDLVVPGTPRRRHWLARFRTRLPEISAFNNLCSSLSDARSFALQNLLQLPIHLFTRNPRISAHIAEGKAKRNKCEKPEMLLQMKVASLALPNARTRAKLPPVFVSTLTFLGGIRTQCLLSRS